jgi:hypothetical protein
LRKWQKGQNGAENGGLSKSGKPLMNLPFGDSYPEVKCFSAQDCPG